MGPSRAYHTPYTAHNVRMTPFQLKVVAAMTVLLYCLLGKQMLGLECRVALPNGVSALSVAASPEVLLSGWSDGFIQCHSRLPTGPHQQRGAAMFTIPNAHVRTHATGVTALQLSNRCGVMECICTGVAISGSSTIGCSAMHAQLGLRCRLTCLVAWADAPMQFVACRHAQHADN